MVLTAETVMSEKDEAVEDVAAEGEKIRPLIRREESGRVDEDGCER